MCDSLVVEDEFHFIFHCSLHNNIRDTFLQHVSNTILNINEKNEIDKIKMLMSKEFVSYFAKIISNLLLKLDMINCLLKLGNFEIQPS